MTKRVLYAEDELSNRMVMQLALRDLDVRLDLAEDGNQALALCEANDYDLILLDQYMPGKNGDQVARALTERGVRTPLVAITSDDTWVSALQGMGYADVFIKPLTGSGFLERIRELLVLEG